MTTNTAADQVKILCARVMEMRDAAYTFGEYSKEAVCIALDGVIDEINAAFPPERAATQPAGEATTDQWRTLALQYDGHRMQALWHLKAMLQDAAKHAPIVVDFLKAAPSSVTTEPDLSDIIARFPELNMSNYDDVDVDRLNAWGIELCEAWDDRAAPAPAPSAPAEAVSVRDAIFRALRGYHMTNMNFSDDEGGGGYTLVDLMTPDCKSIGEGEAEMQILADEIDAAIRALQGKPEAQAGETGGAA